MLDYLYVSCSKRANIIYCGIIIILSVKHSTILSLFYEANLYSSAYFWKYMWWNKGFCDEPLYFVMKMVGHKNLTMWNSFISFALGIETQWQKRFSSILVSGCFYGLFSHFPSCDLSLQKNPFVLLHWLFFLWSYRFISTILSSTILSLKGSTYFIL